MEAYWGSLLAAFALMLVLEGLLPFLSPGGWRALFRRFLELSDGQIRFVETDYFPVVNLTRPALEEKPCHILGSLCTPHDVWGYAYWGDDILPGEAWRVENLRRRVLDLFVVNGYELVMPPLVEYLDSLLTGSGHDLGLRTFKLVDQLSGRTLGLRADITPQASRIDAHLLNRQGITRLCYSGSVVHTLPSGILKTREPLQIGAEIYGHAGVESDVEIQLLMLRALALAGVDNVHLDLGHVAIFRSIIQWAQIDREAEAESKIGPRLQMAGTLGRRLLDFDAERRPRAQQDDNRQDDQQ